MSAQPGNLYDSYDAEGLKEDVSDLIHNISPTETPGLSAMGTTTATQKMHQWQTDVLEAPQPNAFEEGADAALVEPTPTVLNANYLQISKKTFGVSGTLEITQKYGRDSEMAYLAAKSARELKTDVDFVMFGTSQGTDDGTTGGVRLSAAFECWLATNSVLGATGSIPGYANGQVPSRTDGTPRPFTQTLLDQVIQNAWTNGGRPSVILAGPVNKTILSGFDGVGPRRTDAAGRTIVATADLYVSNFGELRVVPSRHIRQVSNVDYNVFVMDPEYAKVAYLRPWQQYDLAKSGDSIKREMLVEWTLEMCNEKAHGIVGDLDGS